MIDRLVLALFAERAQFGERQHLAVARQDRQFAEPVDIGTHVEWRLQHDIARLEFLTELGVAELVVAHHHFELPGDVADRHVLQFGLLHVDIEAPHLV